MSRLKSVLSNRGDVTHQGGRLHFAWDFSEVALPIAFLYYYQCTFSDQTGTTVYGFGEGVSRKTAILKSFSEAWERWWMLQISKSNNEVKNTNGFAAGRTEEGARNASRAELLERANVLESWRTGSGWMKLPFYISPIADLVIRLIEKDGWTVRLHHLSIYEGSRTVCAFAMHSQFGLSFDSVYVERSINPISLGQRVLKLSLSIYRAIQLQKITDFDPSFRLTESGGPIDHIKFYRNPMTLLAYDQVVKPTPISLPHPLISTRTIFPGDDTFPAVALSTAEGIPELSWGSKALTYLDIWPHPIG